MMNFHSLSLEELQKWCLEQGQQPFRARQVFDWVYKKLEDQVSSMTNLPLSFREKLSKQMRFSSLKQVGSEESKDLETFKFLWELEDGRFVESVLILAPGRRTVCVSSQVGCPARCAFCASGKEGLVRNLTAEEIFEQVYRIQKWLHAKGEKVSHIVFMGMGEPLENYEQVIKAIYLLIEESRLHFSERKITVSTVGVIEGIRRLCEEEVKVNLVLSLHAPNQHLRKKIIPYARRYELGSILEAMRDYAKISKRDLTYEYTLLAGINDSLACAEELAQLVKEDPCTVNLIPYNPVEGLHLQRPSKEGVEQFKILLEQKGVVTTWRYTKGKDIAAACGQLALKKTLRVISSL